MWTGQPKHTWVCLKFGTPKWYPFVYIFWLNMFRNGGGIPLYTSFSDTMTASQFSPKNPKSLGWFCGRLKICSQGFPEIPLLYSANFIEKLERSPCSPLISRHHFLGFPMGFSDLKAHFQGNIYRTPPLKGAPFSGNGPMAPPQREEASQAASGGFKYSTTGAICMVPGQSCEVGASRVVNLAYLGWDCVIGKNSSQQT